MASLHEQILAAFSTSINAIPSLGATVYRGRQSPQMRIDNSVVVIEPGYSSAAQDVHTKLNWQFNVKITVIARGSPPDQAADPIVTLVHNKIMSDLTVGGLAYDVQPQSFNWDLMSADKDAAIVSCEYLVLYRSSLTDITVP